LYHDKYAHEVIVQAIKRLLVSVLVPVSPRVVSVLVVGSVARFRHLYPSTSTKDHQHLYHNKYAHEVIVQTVKRLLVGVLVPVSRCVASRRVSVGGGQRRMRSISSVAGSVACARFRRWRAASPALDLVGGGQRCLRLISLVGGIGPTHFTRVSILLFYILQLTIIHTTPGPINNSRQLQDQSTTPDNSRTNQ